MRRCPGRGQPQARSRGIKRNILAVGSAQEGVRHDVRVWVESHDYSLCIVGETRSAATRVCSMFVMFFLFRFAFNATAPPPTLDLAARAPLQCSEPHAMARG